jgi:hypothetical protein
MLKIIGCIGIAVLSAGFSYAQQAVSSAGGNGSGSGGTVSYTVGETNYTSHKSSSGSVIEGVQQSFEIHVVTQSDQNTAISLECETYPNPATDYLILKINSERIENMRYQLFDLNGKVLEEAFIGDTETVISLKNYKSANYLLKVLDNSTEVITFKITKTDKL